MPYKFHTDRRDKIAKGYYQPIVLKNSKILQLDFLPKPNVSNRSTPKGQYELSQRLSLQSQRFGRPLAELSKGLSMSRPLSDFCQNRSFSTQSAINLYL